MTASARYWPSPRVGSLFNDCCPESAQCSVATREQTSRGRDRCSLLASGARAPARQPLQRVSSASRWLASGGGRARCWLRAAAGLLLGCWVVAAGGWRAGSGSGGMPSPSVAICCVVLRGSWLADSGAIGASAAVITSSCQSSESLLTCSVAPALHGTRCSPEPPNHPGRPA